MSRLGRAAPLLALLAVSCMREHAEATPVGASVIAPLAPPASAAAKPAPTIPVELVLAGDGGARPSPPLPDAAAAPPLEPSLTRADGTLLPQTEDRPSRDTALFKRRVDLLFKAIVADDASIALPFFFPLDAYKVVKDIDKPERDWKLRLVAHFRRDIHEYHQKLGADPDKLALVGLDVPEERVAWMKPGSEGNRLGYYRVLGSRLRYTDAAGEHVLPVTSLISWRGVWYVVHLHGFK